MRILKAIGAQAKNQLVSQNKGAKGMIEFMPQQNHIPLKKDLLHRPRLHTLLSQALQYPFCMILAGPGYSKTHTMADYISTCGANTLWFRLSRLDNLSSYFWNHLVRLTAYEYPGLSESIRLLGFPQTMSMFDNFIDLLEKNISIQKPFIWVFDDFGEISNQEVRDFFWMLSETEIMNFHFVILSSDLTRTSFAAHVTGRHFLVSADDLRFTRDEIADLYRMHGISPEPDEIEKIEQYTEGWPLPLHLFALQYEKIKDRLVQGGKLTHQTVTKIFEERYFSSYSLKQQKLLIKLSSMNSFNEEFALSLTDMTRPESDLLKNHVFVAADPVTDQHFFHRMYRMFLQSKSHMLSEKETSQFYRCAADYYLKSNAPFEAISYYRRCADYINMLHVIFDFAMSHFGMTQQNAEFFLEHLDLLTPEQRHDHPIADGCRVLIYTCIFETDKAEPLIFDLEQRLPQIGSKEALSLLGHVYIAHGLIALIRAQETFGYYFKKAADCLPDGSKQLKKNELKVYDNHSFFMPNNSPGARERIERAIHYGIPLFTKVMNGSMNGMEYIFSAEAAYLSCQFEQVRHYISHAIHNAAKSDQHDLICNSYLILSRTAFMRGDFNEMTAQINNIVDYARKHEVGVLKEIRDTALAWYYTRLKDYKRIPKSIMSIQYSGKSRLSYVRKLLVYANYLLNVKQFTQLVNLLDHIDASDAISTDRIAWHIILAVGHFHLGNMERAMELFWKAYDMTYHNGLTVLFIEAQEHMTALIDFVRTQNDYSFDPKWLDFIYERAADFAKLSAAVQKSYRLKNAAKVNGTPLTKNETEILQALSQGLTREKIAMDRYISINTVKTYIRSIYNKLDASNRADAISIAISRGYIEARK